MLASPQAILNFSQVRVDKVESIDTLNSHISITLMW